MPPLATPWTITTTPFDDADADRLRRAQRRELDARYGSSDHEPGVPPSAADVPVFLVARSEDGTALACGGLRPLTDDVLGPGVVEVKRMYTVPEARGTGVAAAVLRALEEEARRLGATRLVLETGTAQPDAIRFYQREGYAPIPLFGAYVGSGNSVCFGRSLDAGAAGADGAVGAAGADGAVRADGTAGADGAVRAAGAQCANTSSSV